MNVVIPPNRPQRPPGLHLLSLFFGILISLVSILFFAKKTYQSPIIQDERGNVELAPHRKAKLDKKLEELESAEQYALLAISNGWYPCYSCPDTTTIFLYAGEVWKYGFTTKKEARYVQSFYAKLRVKYLTQKEGTIEACMQEEIVKIMEYPLLPEARIRPVILERPPGNKKDS